MRVDPKIRKAVNTASFDQLKKWWLGEPPDWVESTIRFRHVLRKKIWELPEGIQFLKNYARHGKGKRKFQALVDLSNKKVADDEVIHLLTKAFDSPDPAGKYGALMGLRRIKKFPLARQPVESLMHNYETGWERDLAGLAFLYLVQAYPKEAAQTLSEGLESPNHKIRMYACDEIWTKGLFELLPKVKKRIKDSNWNVSIAARNCVDMLKIKQKDKSR